MEFQGSWELLQSTRLAFNKRCAGAADGPGAHELRFGADVLSGGVVISCTGVVSPLHTAGVLRPYPNTIMPEHRMIAPFICMVEHAALLVGKTLSYAADLQDYSKLRCYGECAGNVCKGDRAVDVHVHGTCASPVSLGTQSHGYRILLTQHTLFSGLPFSCKELVRRSTVSKVYRSVSFTCWVTPFQAPGRASTAELEPALHSCTNFYLSPAPLACMCSCLSVFTVICYNSASGPGCG
jgi:hypothetical protein